jgi:hypothetical protein
MEMKSNLDEISDMALSVIATKYKLYYLPKKQNYEVKSAYIKYLQERVFPKLNLKKLKEITLPLIASFLVTDGYISVRHKKEMDVFELGFANKNLELIDAFNDLIYITFNEIPSNVQYGKMPRSRFVASWHVPMINEIFDYVYLNGKKNIDKFLCLDNQILFECFRIAMSCDGFVTFWVSRDAYLHSKIYNRIRGSLQLGCKPIKLRLQWKKVTEVLELDFNMLIDRIKCSDYQAMEKFYQLGGFIPNTLICGNSDYYEGIEKNKLLEALLKVKKQGKNNIVSNYDVGQLLRQRVTAMVK